MSLTAPCQIRVRPLRSAPFATYPRENHTARSTITARIAPDTTATEPVLSAVRRSKQSHQDDARRHDSHGHQASSRAVHECGGEEPDGQDRTRQYAPYRASDCESNRRERQAERERQARSVDAAPLREREQRESAAKVNKASAGAIKRDLGRQDQSRGYKEDDKPRQAQRRTQEVGGAIQQRPPSRRGDRPGRTTTATTARPRTIRFPSDARQR